MSDALAVVSACALHTCMPPRPTAIIMRIARLFHSTSPEGKYTSAESSGVDRVWIVPMNGEAGDGARREAGVQGVPGFSSVRTPIDPAVPHSRINRALILRM